MAKLTDFKIIKEKDTLKIFIGEQEIKGITNLSLNAKSPTDIKLNLTVDVSLI